MSFILDALKKSEVERQRQSVPGLIDAGVLTRRRRWPWWAVLLGALLVINLSVLAVVLMRGAPVAQSTNRAHGAPLAQSASPAESAAAAGGAEPSEAEGGHFSPLGPAPLYAPEIPVESSSSTVPRAAAATGSPHAARRSEPLLKPQPEASEDNDEILPSISELNLSGSQALPDIHLDVHVYATKPSDRFVYINMRKYHEGNTLQEGPVLERIRRDGVVLNQNGLRFLVPRQ